MRNDAMFSHQSPVKITIGSHLKEDSINFLYKLLKGIYTGTPVFAEFKSHSSQQFSCVR